ncbi:MAG: hypothetical protein ACN6NX_11525 [Acinetobacter sp.]
MKSNLTQHPCTNKCTNFKAEQCAQCLIVQLDQREFELGLAPDDAYVKTAEDFIAGDVVVFIDASKTDGLMTVHKVQGNGVLLDGNRNFALAHLIRHANVAELGAKRRLTAVELAVGEVS